jgi:hypothetical protein
LYTDFREWSCKQFAVKIQLQQAGYTIGERHALYTERHALSLRGTHYTPTHAHCMHSHCMHPHCTHSHTVHPHTLYTLPHCMPSHTLTLYTLPHCIHTHQRLLHRRQQCEGGRQCHDGHTACRGLSHSGGGVCREGGRGAGQ